MLVYYSQFLCEFKKLRFQFKNWEPVTDLLRPFLPKRVNQKEEVVTESIYYVNPPPNNP